MPQHESPKKHMRSDLRKRARNRMVRSQVKSAVRQVREAATRAEAEKLLPTVFSALDKAAKRNIMKTGTASRQKSRLALLAGRKA